ncbi:hypothetical protein L6452_31283 [Arctium lappa]|uniref:Uncharacterized protein n=1 Tax=Arctium lappa TaxID=4217 RepID=A0ACB8ZLF7_ARCLA|nr:hypothetical protein L6452_31283 [Arctium lappa]
MAPASRSTVDSSRRQQPSHKSSLPPPLSIRPYGQAGLNFWAPTINVFRDPRSIKKLFPMADTKALAWLHLESGEDDTSSVMEDVCLNDLDVNKLFKLILDHLQLDNQLPLTLIPVLLAPEEASDMNHPVFKMTITICNENRLPICLHAGNGWVSCSL